MSLAERVGAIFQRRQLDKQIEWVGRLEQQIKEIGGVTQTQLNFADAQKDLVEPREQEYWDEKASEVFEDLSSDKLDKMLERLPPAEITLIINSLKQDLQQRRDDLG